MMKLVRCVSTRLGLASVAQLWEECPDCSLLGGGLGGAANAIAEKRIWGLEVLFHGLACAYFFGLLSYLEGKCIAQSAHSFLRAV
jgi:hypothetical protein